MTTTSDRQSQRAAQIPSRPVRVAPFSTPASGRAESPPKSSFIVVANRLPARRVTEEGRRRWKLSPGGLVSALTPVLEQRGGAWVGWDGTTGEPPPHFDLDGVNLLPFGLCKEEVSGYYEGFANRTLWPLYHDLVRPPEYRRQWWPSYVDVNRRAAEAAVRAASENATVWVQDYHLQLVPETLRGMRPDLRIGFFLHIPFPQPKLFAQLPWRRQILEGLLGADVIGFQTSDDAAAFRDAADRYTDAVAHGDRLTFDGRSILARDFPISIDTRRFEALARDPQAQRRAAQIRHALGGRRIILGVDRLDYTKGIDQRLRAFDEALKNGRLSAKNDVLVQIAVPSRQRVQEYVQLRRQIDETVGGINGQHADVSGVAIQYLRRSFPPEELVSFYLAADVMLVTPVRDGMNLVAKEYVATRFDDSGVLVLSEFTGAANELSGGALLVNPFDLDGLALTLEAALQLPPEDGRRRMAAMRSVIKEQDVHFWATSFLDALTDA